MRICPKCKQEKSAKAFASNKLRWHKQQDYCRDCMAIAVKQSKIRHPLTKKRCFRKWYMTLEGRASRLYTAAKNRATRFKVPFSLTKDWVLQKITIGVCERTGIKLDFETSGVGKKPHIKSFAPSLHRVIPKKGYTIKNTELVCWIFNRFANASPNSELVFMAKQFLKQERRKNAIQTIKCGGGC